MIFKLELIEILGDKDELPVAIRCKVATGESCDEKEKAYIEKIGNWTDDKKTAELKRLEKLIVEKKNMKPELVNWIRRRSKILEQTLDLDETAAVKEEEL